MRQIGVWEEVDRSECEKRTGRGPTAVRWVDVAKEGGVRSRLAPHNFKAKGERGREDLFAAMPPLEAKKILFKEASRMQCRQKGANIERWELLFVDVKKAHLKGILGDDECQYVELPDEANADGQVGCMA